MPGTKSVTRPVGTRSGVYVVCTWITVPPASRQARASATKFATASSAWGTGSKPCPNPTWKSTPTSAADRGSIA